MKKYEIGVWVIEMTITLILGKYLVYTRGINLNNVQSQIIELVAFSLLSAMGIIFTLLMAKHFERAVKSIRAFNREIQRAEEICKLIN